MIKKAIVLALVLLMTALWMVGCGGSTPQQASGPIIEHEEGTTDNANNEEVNDATDAQGTDETDGEDVADTTSSDDEDAAADGDEGEATTDDDTEETATDESEVAADNAGNQRTIALVMKTLTNPFFVEMEKGAREAEEELGIELVVRTGAQETSIEQQISIIKELVEEEVDAIVIAPADSKELIPALKEAQDAGIVIVNVDNRLDAEVSESVGLVDVPFISVDNEQGAYLSAQYISDQITTPTEAIIIEGIRTAKNADDRKNGALRAFEENETIEVVAMETANWKIDEGYDVTKKLFEEHPDVKAVFCANDMMSFGTIQYLNEAGKTDVLVAAYDALEEAKEFIRSGELQATIDQQAALQAYTGVQFAVDALAGKELEQETIVDVLLVTQDNVDG